MVRSYGPIFIGREITISGSTWVLGEKISEKVDSRDKRQCESMNDIREARAVFVCSKRYGYGPNEAVMKIIMQLVPR